MFMRSLGREIHHCRESNLCPTRDSDWHLPSHKETFLALAHWICQPMCRPLFIWADSCNWLFCSWADDYKLLCEMVSISGVKWKDCVWHSLVRQPLPQMGRTYCTLHAAVVVFQWTGLFLTALSSLTTAVVFSRVKQDKKHDLCNIHLHNDEQRCRMIKPMYVFRLKNGL